MSRAGASKQRRDTLVAIKMSESGLELEGVERLAATQPTYCNAWLAFFWASSFWIRFAMPSKVC